MASSTGGHPEQSWPSPEAGQTPSGKLPTPADLIEEMSSGLARNWWAIALRGALGIAFGIWLSSCRQP